MLVIDFSMFTTSTTIRSRSCCCCCCCCCGGGGDVFNSIIPEPFRIKCFYMLFVLFALNIIKDSRYLNVRNKPPKTTSTTTTTTTTSIDVTTFTMLSGLMLIAIIITIVDNLISHRIIL